MDLPDDIADYLERRLDPSEAVADALRPRMERATKTRAMLAAAGFRSTPESRAWARSVVRRMKELDRAEMQRRRELTETDHSEEI